MMVDLVGGTGLQTVADLYQREAADERGWHFTLSLEHSAQQRIRDSRKTGVDFSAYQLLTKASEDVLVRAARCLPKFGHLASVRN